MKKFPIVVASLSVAVLGLSLSGCARKVTAATLAAEVNKQMTFPKDLGDGIRLDSVAASGNDVVSTVTMTEVDAGASNPKLAQVLADASKTDTCREIAPARQEYVSANIRMVKVFNDKSGAEVVRVVVDPRECT